MSAALLIDVILWGSVIAVGFIAWQKGPVVLSIAGLVGGLALVRHLA